MENKKITYNDVADAIINVSKNIGLCDEETAIGFRTSKKKNILKSKKEKSFGDFTNEIKKRQAKKRLGGINNDNL